MKKVIVGLAMLMSGSVYANNCVEYPSGDVRCIQQVGPYLIECWYYVDGTHECGGI